MSNVNEHSIFLQYCDTILNMANQIITLKLNEIQIKKIESTFSQNKITKTPPYAYYQLKCEGCVITAYTSGKVVFQGIDAEIYASPFMQKKEVILPQAGSDEVGTGDYFGPVVVCASYIDEKVMQLIQSLNVRDSKVLTDIEIRKIAPELEKNVIHSTLVLMPSKYNKVHETTNLNAIKAKMHNQAYINLSKKVSLPDFKIIDQFAPEPLYYRYLQNDPTVIRNIHFETKAEDKYPSVAISSMIARFAFLDAMDKMNAAYEMEFQKGGGDLATKCGEEFVKKYSFERLHEVAKIHFKNTEKIENRD